MSARAISGQPNWYEKTAAYWADFIFDQKRILDGYRIRFAVDFKDLKSFLRPWGASNEDPPLLESILAIIWLTYRIEEKHHLAPPILLPEYVNEYVEHIAYTTLTGVWSEWNTMRNVSAALMSKYPILRTADAATSAPLEQTLRQGGVDVPTIMEQEFDTFIKLSVSSHYFDKSGGASSAWLNVIDQFADSSTFRPYWHDIRKGELYKRLLQSIQHSVIDAHDSSIPIHIRKKKERTSQNDAAALQRVIQLNEALQRRGEKEIVYLLTSSGRFWKANDHDAAFREATSLKIAGSVESHSVLRHPFCIILLLTHFPPSAISDQNSRRELVKSLEEQSSGIQAYASILRQSSAQIAQADQKSQQSAYLAPYRDAQQLYGHWSNLALALRQNDLMPSAVGKDVSRGALRFLNYLRETDFAGFRDAIEAKRDEAHDELINAILRLIEHFIDEIVTDEFVQRCIGTIGAYPYLLQFHDPRIGIQINELHEARLNWKKQGADALESVREKIRLSLLRLAQLLAPTTTARLDSRDTVILAASLLLAFDQYDEVRRVLRATKRMPINVREFEYLQALLEYRRLMRTQDVTAKDFSDALGRIDADRARADPRIEVQRLVMRVREHVLRVPRATKEEVDELVNDFEKLANTAKALPAPTLRRKWGEALLTTPVAELFRGRKQTELAYRVLNNYVYALLDLAESFGLNNLAERAYDLATAYLRSTSEDLPTEVKDTVAIACYRFGLTLPLESDRRRAVLDEARSLIISALKEKELLEIGGEGPLMEIDKHHKQIITTCNAEEI